MSTGSTAGLAPVPININISGCNVDRNPVPLSRGNGDRARWISNDGRAYLIHFEESPFDSGPGPADYFVPASDHADSGPVRSNAATTKDRGKPYKYSVVSAGQGISWNDPDADITP